MANPRKFSEKIALHNQKQAEETAAFEKIMREVSDATNKVNSGSRQSRAKAQPKAVENVDASLKPNQQGLGSYRSGSLPNVAAPQTNSAEQQSLKPEETTLATQYGLSGRSGGTSPSRSPGQRGRASSSVGPMRRPADRKHDTSPYGSSVYLSPPPDSNWRRTNSDSALHQSCGEPQMTPQPLSPHHPLHSHSHPHQHPHQNHRRPGDMHLAVFSTLGINPNTRPRSSCEIPRMPNNNNMYCMNEGDNSGGLSCDMQVPGGSLPDLTSVRYPHRPPMDPHYYLGANNKVNLESLLQSPSPEGAVSPGGVSGRGSVSPATGGLSPASGSPVGATVPPPQPHDHHLYDAQNHLSVPNTNNYSHHSKNMSTLEHNWIASSYQSHCSPPSQYSSTSNINIPSPTMVHSPGSPVESPQTDYNNLHQLLQPFEQITMLDPPVSSYSTPYMNHSSPQQPHSPQTTNTPHTYTQAPQQPHTESEVRRRARDPVPGGGGLLQPPGSIPDIILTDYSGELDAGIFGGEEAQLRAGLDLDDLTLLEEPSALLPDSSVEHEFRLDRL